MPEFEAISVSECADRLLAVNNPLVLMHIRPDGDTVGSSAALCEIFRAMGKEARYACADKIPERLAFLTEGLLCANTFDGYEAIAVDVASPAQLGEFFDKVKVSLTIDHHEFNTPFSPNYTVKGASSAGEVIFGIARELESRGAIKMNKRIAERLYAAISSDTGGFVFSNAAADTYRNAAELIEYGIDHADINHKLFMSKTPEQISAEGLVASKVKRSAQGKIAYAVISREDMESIGLTSADFDCGIDVVRSIMGVEIAFIVKETERGFKASLRSVGANVAEIAAKHGGGGHIRAAGCTVEAATVSEAAEILISELSELFGE